MEAATTQKTYFVNLGKMEYQPAWDLQEAIFSRMVQWKQDNRREGVDPGPIPDHHLLFCEHPHVYTLGKSGSESNLLINREQLAAHEASYVKINRGGDITYHGPGQIVGYPILDLERFFTDIHRYMRSLEEGVIRTLSDYGIEAGRLEGLTGVWLDPDDPLKARKICALGVKSSRWVTMHGFAFNVNPDLSYFNHIVPCGITDKAVTSMEKELGTAPPLAEVENKLKDHLADVFGMQLVEQSAETLMTTYSTPEAG
ncbi:MAG: lipoyl(octanoyl) transferase LipB [Flavobacteriales bacterium]|nr:lipoyl(octanoyl) transferase LipB [Flavobacteriales bacterium]MCB9449557.1 lipoyl(octanoyl) transferase LipB [Flavobacteriales bacterium]